MKIIWLLDLLLFVFITSLPWSFNQFFFLAKTIFFSFQLMQALHRLFCSRSTNILHFVHRSWRHLSQWYPMCSFCQSWDRPYCSVIGYDVYDVYVCYFKERFRLENNTSAYSLRYRLFGCRLLLKCFTLCCFRAATRNILADNDNVNVKLRT